MRKKRKKLKKFVHISSILGETLSGFRYKPGIELESIWKLWNGTVGNDIANNAQPAAFKEKELIVHVTDSAWTHHLHFHKEIIITKLNNALGKELVEKIKFKVGQL